MDETATIVGGAVAATFFVALLAGGVLVVRDTLRGRGRFGINLRPVSCPRCGEPMPAVRKPANFRQAMWGGGTCPECGCEVDKWGREVGEP